jgi:hypothetical protein
MIRTGENAPFGACHKSLGNSAFMYNFIPLLKGDIIIKLQQLLILVHWKSGKQLTK